LTYCFGGCLRLCCELPISRSPRMSAWPRVTARHPGSLPHRTQRARRPDSPARQRGRSEGHPCAAKSGTRSRRSGAARRRGAVIASSLVVAVSAVEQLLSRVNRKLKVPGRAELPAEPWWPVRSFLTSARDFEGGV